MGQNFNLDQTRLTPKWQSWPLYLRRAVVINLLVVVTLGLTAFLLVYQGNRYQQQLKALNQQKLQEQQRLAESEQERSTITRLLPLLNDLKARNIFGEEKRLEWVETLRKIEKRWPGMNIKYEISPQKIIPPPTKLGLQATPLSIEGVLLPSGAPAKNFAVFSTSMVLTLQLLHEGDAFAVFDELNAANLGFFKLARCTFTRQANATDNTPTDKMGEPVLADCELTWISMDTYVSK
jgi:cell division protein FtsB